MTGVAHRPARDQPDEAVAAAVTAAPATGLLAFGYRLFKANVGRMADIPARPRCTPGGRRLFKANQDRMADMA